MSHVSRACDIAVCCVALQCVAVRCSALQSVAVCCGVCCRPIHASCHTSKRFMSHTHVTLQHPAVCGSALQCIAVRCSVLQFVADLHMSHVTRVKESCLTRI